MKCPVCHMTRGDHSRCHLAAFDAIPHTSSASRWDSHAYRAGGDHVRGVKPEANQTGDIEWSTVDPNPCPKCGMLNTAITGRARKELLYCHCGSCGLEFTAVPACREDGDQMELVA